MNTGQVDRPSESAQRIRIILMGDSTNFSIVLASESPRRSALLAGAGIKFRVRSSLIDEESLVARSPRETALLRAYEKARAATQEGGGEELVLAADTIIEHNGRPLGKPVDKVDAWNVLASLSGEKCAAITSIVVVVGVDAEIKYQTGATVVTDLSMRPYPHDAIEWYLSTGEYEGKAGSFGIQGLGSILVDDVVGCFTNVVGLPLCRALALISLTARNVCKARSTSEQYSGAECASICGDVFRKVVPELAESCSEVRRS